MCSKESIIQVCAAAERGELSNHNRLIEAGCRDTQTGSIFNAEKSALDILFILTLTVSCRKSNQEGFGSAEW